MEIVIDKADGYVGGDYIRGEVRVSRSLFPSSPDYNLSVLLCFRATQHVCWDDHAVMSTPHSTIVSSTSSDNSEFEEVDLLTSPANTSNTSNTTTTNDPSDSQAQQQQQQQQQQGSNSNSSSPSSYTSLTVVSPDSAVRHDETEECMLLLISRCCK
jgi:hypothetical protein